jgi:hypothetical protein
MAVKQETKHAEVLGGHATQTKPISQDLCVTQRESSVDDKQ